MPVNLEVQGGRAEDDGLLAEDHMAIDGGKVLGREHCRHNTDIDTLNRQEPGFLVFPLVCRPDGSDKLASGYELLMKVLAWSSSPNCCLTRALGTHGSVRLHGGVWPKQTA